MEQIIRIGMDTSKSVFQLHGVDAAERPVLRKQLRREAMVSFFKKLPATVIGIEACGGAHHWAHLLASFGHQVKLCRRNGTHVAETILASGHVRPRKQAGHMIASDPIKPLYPFLQAGGRPHMGPGSRSADALAGRDDNVGLNY
jgi:hypothetical protein